jgi:hypothetical protein
MQGHGFWRLMKVNSFRHLAFSEKVICLRCPLLTVSPGCDKCRGNELTVPRY